MAEYNLLPCPFCGCAYIEIVSNGIGDYFAVCGSSDEECRAEESGCGAMSDPRHCEGQKFAAERWNKRAAAAAGYTIEALYGLRDEYLLTLSDERRPFARMNESTDSPRDRAAPEIEAFLDWLEMWEEESGDG